MTQSLKSALKSSPEGLKRVLRAAIARPLRSYIRFGPTRFGKKLLWNSIGAHLWWLETKTESKTLFGFNLEVDAEDIVGRYLYYFGVWEPNLTDWIRGRLSVGDVFVDVGANIGYYSVLASELVGSSGKVVAIEAAPQTFKVLCKNLERNSARNARAVNIAAWHTEGKLQLFTKPDNIVGTTTVISEWAQQWELRSHCEILAAPLDKILTAEELKATWLIKIDVEGAEWNVLTRLREITSNCRPEVEIMVEIAHKMLGMEGKSCDDLLALFRREGFFPYLIENDYSAQSYISAFKPKPPKRIERIPIGPDQCDLVFSRIDAEDLI